MLFLKPGKRTRVIAALLMLVSSNSVVWAENYTWTGPTLPDTDRTWNLGTNWTSGSAGTALGDLEDIGFGTSNVLFTGTNPGEVPLNPLGQPRTIQSLSFNGTGGYTINNNIINLPGGNSLSQAGSGVNVINTQVNTSAPVTGTVTGGTLQLGNANNAISGAFNVSGGTLGVTGNGTLSGLGTSTVNLTGGTLAISIANVPAAGLNGQYWQTGRNPDQAWFNSLAAFNAHFGSIAPTATSAPGAFPVSFDFNNAGFGGNAPFGEAGVNIGADTVAARWSGLYTPTAAGDTTFFTRSDDGSMLFIDGNLVVSNNAYQGATTQQGTVTFADTNPHQIDVLFFEGGGGAGVQVSQGSDGNFIPQTQLSINTAAAPVLSNAVNVTASSTLSATAGTVATVGATTINRGLTLSTSGNIGSASLTAAGAGATPVTINSLDGTYSVPGLSDGGSTANFVKAGPGTVKLTSAAPTMSPGATVKVDQGTLSAVSNAAGNSLGASPVQLSGGTLNVQSSLQNTPGVIQQSWYINQGNAAVDLHTGGLQVAAPLGSNLLTGQLNYPDEGRFATATATPTSGVSLTQFDNFQFKWSGQLHSDGQGWNFGVGNAGAAGLDDDMSVYVNLDHSVDANGNPTYSQNEQLFRQGCCGTFNSGTTTIPTGDYDFAIGFAEGGGGNSIGATFSTDGGATYNIISPATQPTIFSNNALSTANFSANTISVTANSAITVSNSAGSANVGTVTINRGVALATTGDLTTPTISSGAGVGTITINTTAGTFTSGSLNDSNAAAAFVKTGAGDLKLTSATSDMVAAGSTLTINQGRVSAVADAATSSLGTVPVTLGGGTLRVSSSGNVSGLNGSVYNAVTGLGITNENLGTILTAVPTATATLTGAMNFPQVTGDQDFRDFFGGGNPAADNFSALFQGTFVATTSGNYQFASFLNDDNNVIWIDRDHNGVFSHTGAAGDEMIQSIGCCGNLGNVSTVNLPAGDYKIAFAMEDGGGGSGLVGVFADPNGALQTVNPGVQTGRFFAQLGQANFSATNVHVVANSAVEGGTAQGGASVGNVSIDRGMTLSTSGTLNLASVVASGAGAGSVGLNVAQGGVTNIAALNDGGSTATFLKTGPGEASLTGASASTYSAAATVNVQAGTLTVTNTAAGVSSISSGANNAHVLLSGGTLNVNAVANPAVFTLAPGLIAQLYNRTNDNIGNQDPAFNALSTFNAALNSLSPAVTAIVPDANFQGNNFGDAAPFAPIGFNSVDNIAARFVGKIHITAEQAADPAGVTFATRSDDGSVIFIDGVETPVVNNNFYQGNTLRTGAVALTEGDHDISIGFYEGGGGAGLLAGLLANGDVVTFDPSVLSHQVFGPITYGNTVRVTADSTLSANGAVGSNFGAMTMDAGVKLTKNGTQNSSFASTNLRGDSTFDVATGSLSLGTTTDNSNATSLTKVGVGTLVVNAASNDFNGTDIAVNAGTVALSGAGGLDTAKSLTVNNGGTFDIRTTTLVNNVPVKMNAGSTLAVSAASGSVANLLYNGGSFSGPTLGVTNSLGGVGSLDPTKVALSATVNVSPGNPGLNDGTGTLTMTGDFSQPASGKLSIKLAGTDADQYDHLAVNGAYNRAGTLAVSLVNGFQPHTGDLFTDVFSATSMTGAFGASTGLSLGNNLFLNVVSSPTSAGLLAALPGDSNLDRSTNFTDLGVLLNHFNQPAGTGAGEWSVGDFNDSHVVDFTDLGILLNNFNKTTPLVASAALSSSTAQVPEPSSIVLLSLGLVGMALAGLRARRRQA